MEVRRFLPELHPRRFLAQFAEDTPRFWCGENPVITHILNAYTLLVPGNEGFFIRTPQTGYASNCRY